MMRISSKAWLRLTVFVLLSLAILAPRADARPEKIRPGMSYYSDQSTEANGVRDIAGEKNYEEVYQRYSYYEAVYDDSQRVIRFIEYKKGDELYRLEYAYGPDGSLLTRTLKRPGSPPEVTQVAADAKAD